MEVIENGLVGEFPQFKNCWVSPEAKEIRPEKRRGSKGSRKDAKVYVLYAPLREPLRPLR